VSNLFKIAATVLVAVTMFKTTTTAAEPLLTIMPIPTSNGSKKGWEKVEENYDATVEYGTRKILTLNGTSVFWMRTKISTTLMPQSWDVALNRVYADCVTHEYYLLQTVKYLKDSQVSRDDNPTPKTSAIPFSPIFKAIDSTCEKSIMVEPADIFAGALDG
jgi:hypothetical protein